MIFMNQYLTAGEVSTLCVSQLFGRSGICGDPSSPTCIVGLLDVLVFEPDADGDEDEDTAAELFAD